MTSVLATLPSTPLPDDKSVLLAQLTEGLEPAGLWWLSGYAAGLARAQTPATPRPVALAAEPAPASRLTLIYGSQTGNARRLAEKLAEQLEAAGVSVRLLRADAYPLRELGQERHLLIVISTQGDGDPPDDARGLVEFLQSRRAPRLPE